MKIFLKIATSTLFFPISSCESVAKNDFELFWDFVAETETKEPFTKNNLTKSYKKLITQVENSENYSKELIEIFTLTQMVDPDSKYKLFKESTEAVLRKDWSCDALKHFYFTTAP